MLIEGLKLMLSGMSVVFCFLALLVLAMRGSAALFSGKPGTAPRQGSAGESTAEYAEIAAAIAAVMNHREKG